MIYEYGTNEALSAVASKVKSDEITELGALLRNEFTALGYGQGLSLPQLGISKRGCICKLRRGTIVMFNPTIVKQSNIKQVSYETCLSVPHKEYHLMRQTACTVRYLGADGKPATYTATDFKDARILQHELDHLNGKCLPDVGVFNREY